MKKFRVEFHKSKRSENESKIFTRVIQEVGITEGKPPKHGAFFEDGFEKLFYGFLNAEGYLLAFMDEHMKVWRKSNPGLLFSLSFDAKDFIGNEIDPIKLMKQMPPAEGPIPKSIRENALFIKGLNRGSKNGADLIPTYKGKAI